MNHDTSHIHVLTRLFITSGGEVASRNLSVTLDVFEAEAHKAAGVENDFDTFVLARDWRDDAEQSSFVACMREFREIVAELQNAALR